MRIALVTPQLSIGGAEKMVFQLAMGLKAQGEEVTVIASPGEYKQRLQASGVTVITLPLATQRLWLSPRVWRIFGNWLKKGAYDVIHVQTIPLAVYVRILQRLFAVPSRTILTLHGSPEWKLRLIWPFLQVLKVKRCAVSKHLARVINGQYIPNAVNISEEIRERASKEQKIRELQKRKDQGEGESLGGRDLVRIKVFIVARLVPEKGLDLWFEAVGRLQEQGILIETFVIGDGPERERLKKGIKEKGLDAQFLGWQSEPWAFSSKMDLFVMPSRREGEPLALLEALAAGLPVLATRVGGIPDIATGAGVLVEPTVPGLIAGVKTYLQLTDVQKEKMLKQGRRVLCDRTWQASVDAYRKVYQKGLGGSTWDNE